MSVANIIFFIGTTFLFLKVIKNKNSIKDFDNTGAGLTFIGTCFVILSLSELKMWLSIAFSIPTVLFWLFTFIFSIKK